MKKLILASLTSLALIANGSVVAQLADNARIEIVVFIRSSTNPACRVEIKTRTNKVLNSQKITSCNVNFIELNQKIRHKYRALPHEVVVEISVI